MSYLPLQPGQPAKLGTSGQAVTDLQNSTNAKHASDPGYVPLKVDGLYGPKTDAAINGIKPPLVTTARQAQSEFAEYSSKLQNAMGRFGVASSKSSNANADGTETPKTAEVSDPYTQALDRHSANGDEATKALIASIQAKRDKNASSIDKNYENYKRGVALLGIQHNDAQSSPDLLAGHIVSIENEHIQKIQELDAEESKALIDARIARDNDDIKTLKEKMDYVKELKKQKDEELKSTYDKLSYEAKIGEIEAHAIYSELQKLGADDKETFLAAVAQKFNIPLGTLVTAVADEHLKQVKAGTKKTGSGGKKTTVDKTGQSTFSPTAKKSLNGLGLVQGDIAILEGAINKYGAQAVIESGKLDDAQAAIVKKEFGIK